MWERKMQLYQVRYKDRNSLKFLHFFILQLTLVELTHKMKNIFVFLTSGFREFLRK